MCGHKKPCKWFKAGQAAYHKKNLFEIRDRVPWWAKECFDDGLEDIEPYQNPLPGWCGPCDYPQHFEGEW